MTTSLAPVPHPAPLVAKRATTPASIPQRSWMTSALYGVTLRQRTQMYQQLHTLLNSGIPLVLGLSHLQENVGFSLRPVMREMQEHVLAGETLSSSMTRFVNIFPAWEIQLIRAAETSGTLPEAAGEIARTLEVEVELRRRINSSTFHLKATMVVFIIVVIIVLGAMRGLSGVGDALNLVGNAVLATAGLVIGVLMLRWAWGVFSRTPRGARVSYYLSFYSPLIGPLLRNAMRIRFARVLAALWRAGVAPIASVEAATQASGNLHLVNKLADLLPHLGRGTLLSEVITAMGLFPSESVYLIKSGETAGDIPDALDKVAEMLEIELEAQIHLLPQHLQMAFFFLIVPVVGLFVIWFFMRYVASLNEYLR